MILRVKFMTRPGDQFVVRKLVYQRIRELFAEHGITFAHREVTVRVAGNDEGVPAEEIATAADRRSRAFPRLRRGGLDARHVDRVVDHARANRVEPVVGLHLAGHPVRQRNDVVGPSIDPADQA